MDFSNFKIVELPKPVAEKKKREEKRYVIGHDPVDCNPIRVTVYDTETQKFVFRTTITIYSRLSQWIKKLKLDYRPSIVKVNDIQE